VRIIFLGTPDFAVASLNALIENNMNVVAVVTAPDKPAGRGMKLQQSAVKKFANEKNIPILQPEKLKNPEFLSELKSYNADVQVVVAFRMLPELVWNMPALGTINVHASLLPNYRGAAPINWAIINGEEQTGVTTFKLQHEIDTGNILMQSTVPILEDDTAGSLHDKLMIEGANLLVETLRQLHKGALHELPQLVLDEYKHAPKIFTETCEIDWHQSVNKVYNLIRGLSPYPTAFTTVNNKKMKLFRCDKIIEKHSHVSGKIVTDNKSYIHFACVDGLIDVKELQLEGKVKMKTDEFLRGNKLA
jgi:methionyl-tRNA formyltransferase